MKLNKWNVVGGTVLFLLFAWGGATIAQSTPPAEIDAGVDAFADSLEGQQAQFFAQHGRYAQILPSSGGQATVEVQAVRGGDQLQAMTAPDMDTQADDGGDGLTSPLPTPTTPSGVQCPADQVGCPPVGLVEGVVVAVNVYEAPSGPGYEIVSEYTDGYGQTWRQIQNFGPEVWRNRSWHVVPVEETP